MFWALSMFHPFVSAHFVIVSVGAGYASIIPDASNADSHPLTKALADKINKWVEQYLDAMEKVGVYVKQNQLQICMLRFLFLLASY